MRKVLYTLTVLSVFYAYTDGTDFPEINDSDYHLAHYRNFNNVSNNAAFITPAYHISNITDLSVGKLLNL